jgi:hypothetical protein
MNVGGYRHAQSAIPQPPCERYSCKHLQECQHSQIACESFHYYVSTGRTIKPGMTWSRKRHDYVSADIPPSVAQYNRMMIIGA